MSHSQKPREDISVMEHLMQLYTYDFSEFVDLDVNKDGLFERKCRRKGIGRSIAEQVFQLHKGGVFIGFGYR